MSSTPASPVPSWRPGYYIWPRGQTKLVVLGGIGSRTGDAEKAFSGLAHFLAERGGYEARRDVLEGTYAGMPTDAGWQPRPYSPPDTRAPLIDSAEAVAGCLEWYRQALPSDARLWVMGYSLGGVAALDGATLAIARDRPAWAGRMAGIVTLAAPVRGCNAGAFMNWAWLVTGEADALGSAGRDLDSRWRDDEEQQRLRRRAEFLRAAGVRLLTLSDPDDAVVRPEEALLPGPGDSIEDLLVKATLVRPGSLGHGAILDEPSVWRRLLGIIGPQRLAASQGEKDPIEDELQAIKARMRREGRIK